MVEYQKKCIDCGSAFITTDKREQKCRVCASTSKSVRQFVDDVVIKTIEYPVRPTELTVNKVGYYRATGLITEEPEEFLKKITVPEGKKVSIIVTTMNEWVWTKKTLTSIIENTHYPYTLNVLDAASTDCTPALIRKLFPQVNLYELDNKYWVAYAWNRAIDIAKEQEADYVAILNNDLQMSENWLKGLLWTFEVDPDVGLVSPKFMNPDWNTVRDMGKNRYDWSDETIIFDEYAIVPFTWTVGACFLMPMEAVNKVGYFDEDFFFGCDEIDYCIRMWQEGYRVVCNSVVPIVHYVSRTISKHKGQKGNRAQELYDNYGVTWRFPREYFFEKWDNDTLNAIYETVKPEQDRLVNINRWKQQIWEHGKKWKQD